MIKLNLLPPYVSEMRRIKTTFIIFAVLFALLPAPVLLYTNGLKAQEAWYTTDKQRCDTRAAELTKFGTDSDALTSKVTLYDPWIKLYGDLAPVREYNESIAKALIAAATKIGGGGSWYEEVTVKTDGSVAAKGNIKGSMQFLSYYFRLKDASFTLKPAVQPYDPAKRMPPAKQMAQVVTLEVSGKVDALPTPPALPGTSDAFGSLYKSADSVAAEGAAAGGAPGETPGGVPPGAPPGGPTP